MHTTTELLEYLYNGLKEHHAQAPGPAIPVEIFAIQVLAKLVIDLTQGNADDERAARITTHFLLNSGVPPLPVPADWPQWTINHAHERYTGHHILMPGFELHASRCVADRDDVQPLDALQDLPAGSTVSHDSPHEKTRYIWSSKATR